VSNVVESLEDHQDGGAERLKNRGENEVFADETDDLDVHPSTPLFNADDDFNGDFDDDNDVTTLIEYFLFFVCGLGSSLCYISTLSSLVYFKVLYGANSYVYLSLIIYLPFLPISVIQAVWDQHYDKIYQSRRTFLFRGLVGFSLSLLGTIFINISRNSGLASLCGDALLQGFGGAILYGTLNQMATFTGRGNGQRLKAIILAGVQSSALVVLGVGLTSGFKSHNGERFSRFILSIVAIETVCFVAFLWLLGAPSIAASMVRRDSSLRQLDQLLDIRQGDRKVKEVHLLINDEPSNEQVPQLQVTELSLRELLKYSKACCWILMITLIPSFLVGSWFTRVLTDWISLAQILFYVRIFSDFTGRLVTIIVPTKSTTSLAWIAILRLVPVVLFFLNSRYPHSLSHDYADGFSILLVGIIAFLSGYLVTGCFQLAPQSMPWEFRPTNLSKQASVLTVAFSFAAVGGLVSSLILIAFDL